MRMIRAIKIIFLSIIFLSWNIVVAQDQCKPVGWATQGGGVTGGGNATPTVVSNYADLKSALSDKNVKVVYVSGVITFPLNGRLNIQDTDGKTVIGLAGSRMISVDKTSSGSGILYVKRTTNLILRNLTFEGPGAYDVDGNDNLTFDGVQNAWVDHCDFQDALDGNFDIKNATDYLAVTWCKFSYNKPPIAGGSGGSNDHRFSDLVGSSDTETQDIGKLRITFQYCWWAQGCVERMPRVRFGQIHIANCYYNSTVSNTCIRAGYQADLLIESNVFVGVKNPIDLYQNNFTAVTEINNIYTSTTGGKTGSGTSFTPPYSLTIAPASTVQSLVTNTSCGSGATMNSPTQCGCGTQPANINPTASLTAPTSGSTVCIGTAITISATAKDSDGSILKVDFYNGSTLLGSDNTSPYSISYTPIASGTLSIKAIATDNSSGTGSSAMNTVTVSALPIATITAPTTSICTGSSLLLTASTGSSYKWFNGTTQVGTSAIYAATTAGNYTVEVTNASGCKATSAVTQITTNTLPTATITAPTTFICTGSSLLLTASTGSSYKWFNGTTQVGTSVIYTATTAGNYTMEVTNASGCKATSAVTQITANTLPTATITAPTTSICTGSSLLLTASIGSSYKWFNGTTQVGTSAIYTATTVGNYTVEVTNASGCKATSAVTTVTVNAAPAAPIASATITYCQNETATALSASGTGLLWYTAATGGMSTTTAPIPVTTNNGTTNYYVSQTTTGCESARAMIAVKVINTSTASITTATPTVFCTGGSVVLTASTGTSYKWFNGTTQVSTTATYSATVAGSYSVEVTNGGNCKATSSATMVIVNAIPSVPAVTSTITYCQNETATALSATGTGLLWYTTATGGTSTTTAPIPVTTNNGTTNYYVSQTTTGCESARATIAVTVNTVPVAMITAGSSTSLPQGGSVVLTASKGTSYKWLKGSTLVSTDASYTATAPGAYSVEVTNANNCSAISSATNVNMNSNQPSLITITSPTNSSTVQGAITITATATDPDGSIVLVEYLDGNTVIGTNTSAPYSFVWNTPTASDHVITVRVTDSNGGITTSAPVTVTSEAASTTTGLYSTHSNSLDGVVYPNPANEAVFIDSDSDLSDASFMLVDVLGNEHIVSHTGTGLGAQIDVSNLSSGTYVLIIKKDSSVMRKKITIMK
jgi:pectate lyase